MRPSEAEYIALLQWLDRLGGLGYDKHERIRALLDRSLTRAEGGKGETLYRRHELGDGHVRYVPVDESDELQGARAALKNAVAKIAKLEVEKADLANKVLIYAHRAEQASLTAPSQPASAAEEYRDEDLEEGFDAGEWNNAPPTHEGKAEPVAWRSRYHEPNGDVQSWIYWTDHRPIDDENLEIQSLYVQPPAQHAPAVEAIARELERIIYRRFYANQIDGYTREMSFEQADAILAFLGGRQ